MRPAQGSEKALDPDQSVKFISRRGGFAKVLKAGR
jgi:hypothetical protein